MLRGTAFLLLVVGACVATPPPARAPAPPPPRVAAAASLKWPYWEPVAVKARSFPEPELEGESVEPRWLATDEGWRGASASILGRLRESGIAGRRKGLREWHVGRFYEDRLRRGATVVVTLDALLAVTHLAFANALGEVEARVTRSGLSSMLHRLDARLATESSRARPDLAEGYRVARTAVAVALALSEPAYVVSPELAPIAQAEVERVRAHAGVATSPLFGVPLDYGLATPRGPIGEIGDPRAPLFQAAEWLAMAPFQFAGATEKGGTGIDVGTARGQARGALLVARLLGKDGDLAAGAAFTRSDLLDRFVLGDAADLSPGDVADVARQAGFDLAGGADIADAPKLDRLRHLLAPRSMRLVPLRAAPDGRPLAHAKAGARDVGTWFGVLGAEPHHDSVYGSFLAAMASVVHGGDAPGAPGTGEVSRQARRNVRALLGAWTFLRHDALAFAHDAPSGPAPPPAADAAPEGHVVVEPRPEAIANLLGAVRQLRVGLLDLGGLDGGGPSAAVLAELESLLTLALEGSLGGSPAGEPEALALAPRLARFPSRIAALEAWLGPAAAPVVVDVRVELASGRVLEEGTGPLEELFLRVRDPRGHLTVIAVGASVPHMELEESAAHPSGDVAWRARIGEGLLFTGEAE